MVGLKNEKIVLRIPRNATTELLVVTGEFWNIPIIEIRWHENGKHTKKGVRFNRDEGEKVLKALKRILNDNIYENIEERNEEESQ